MLLELVHAPAWRSPRPSLARLLQSAEAVFALPPLCAPFAAMAEPTTPSTLELTAAHSVLDEEEELAYELAVAEEDGTLKVRKRLFACICVLNIAMNFDAGVLPATLSHVEEQFDGSCAPPRPPRRRRCRPSDGRCRQIRRWASSARWCTSAP